MKVYITISNQTITTNEIKNKILENLNNANEKKVIIELKEDSFRSVDPSIIVAIISASTGVLSSLFICIFNNWREKKLKSIGKIIIELGGARFELPSNATKEEITEVLEVFDSIDISKYEKIKLRVE